VNNRSIFTRRSGKFYLACRSNPCSSVNSRCLCIRKTNRFLYNRPPQKFVVRYEMFKKTLVFFYQNLIIRASHLGSLAQSVEQLAFNQLVAGSNPARPTTLNAAVNSCGRVKKGAYRRPFFIRSKTCLALFILPSTIRLCDKISRKFALRHRE
jgi:hypothetical protein